jgi:hypothetical protein
MITLLWTKFRLINKRKGNALERSLVILKHTASFDDFVNSVDWHDAYLSELQYLLPRSTVDHIEEAFFQPIQPGLVRLIIRIPAVRTAVEFVAFEAQSVSFCLYEDLDEEKTAFIQRRNVELDFGAFALKCSALAYRTISADLAMKQLCFQESPFDEKGNLIEPYSIDWRSALDAR